MPDEKRRDWVDVISALLIPILIFAAGAWLTHQKDQSDKANQQFQQDSDALKLAASSNNTESRLGFKTIEILKQQNRWSREMDPVLQAMAQGPTDAPSTYRAKDALKDQTAPQEQNQLPTVYFEIARDDQRGEASTLTTELQKAGYKVPDMELVNPGTQNTYVRVFSAANKQHADKILQMMKNIGIDAQEQDFSNTDLRDKTQPGVLEVWLGHKQVPLPKNATPN